MILPHYQPLWPLRTESPLVSVVMFCRNRVHCLRAAIESILGQSYPHWELVIQDGASTDGSQELIRQFSDPRIKLVSEPDGGPFEAMWRALRRCEGEIIGFCLSDEQWLPQSLTEGVNYFLCHPEAAALSRDLYYTDLVGGQRVLVESAEFNFHDYLGQQSKMSLVTVLLRRLALEELHWRERPWRTDCADFELLGRIGERFRFDYYPGPSALFAQGHPGQLSTTPEVGFFCTQGHLRFIDEFYRESPDRNLLRDLALQNAYEPVDQLYQRKGSRELQERLSALYAEFAVRTTVASIALADQAAGLGLIDLALKFLMEIRPSSTGDFQFWLHRSLQLLAFFPQQEGALEKWSQLAALSYPESRERLLVDQLRVGSVDPAKILFEQMRWGKTLQAKAPRVVRNRNRPKAAPRLKVAFHSPSWSTVESETQILPLVPYLKARGLEVILYTSSDLENSTPAESQGFVSLAALDTVGFAQKIQQDEVDVLIEFGSLKAGLPWSALAMRCAPIQLSYLGHMATTGLDTINYLVVDETLAPSGESNWSTESMLRLPDCYSCFSFPSGDPPRTLARRRLDPRLTWASFAPCSLINSALLDCWIKLLQAVPDSRLFLSNVEMNACDVRTFLRNYFLERGIATHRLLLAARREGIPATSMTDQIDVYLDTFPHGDPTGVACALSRGIPSVTLMGPTLAGRLGSSILRAADLPMGIASCPDEYIQRAAELANRPQELSQYLTQLPEQLFARGLTNPASFAEKLHQALVKL